MGERVGERVVRTQSRRSAFGQRPLSSRKFGKRPFYNVFVIFLAKSRGPCFRKGGSLGPPLTFLGTPLM